MTFTLKIDKIKDSKMKILIDELESPESNVLLPQLLDYDSTLNEEMPKIDTLPSFPFKNEDKVFNPGILVHGSTHFVTNEENLLSVTETLLSFSSENEDKVFNPGIPISKGVHYLTLGLPHWTYETFKIVNVHPNILNESPMKIFPYFCFSPNINGIRGESS
ncbi:hypothetical protein Tco_0558963 [Tanacetum coccineum]